ncbi:MAG TPA: TonB-dependent receptor [Porticoccaceae bacterium]|nr:TonB-dependent receptor [Porticoccaceae bacterium]HIK79749.1 TonB-dependent receptor [Porticoccaceae bacterium]
MRKISLLSLVLTLSATSLQAQTVAADTEIQEVLVSASLVPIAVSRSANAITVIDREQINNRAALSVSELLRDVPGFAVSRSGVQGSQTQIRVRGAEANHLLVMIDGVEANDPSQSDELNWGTLVADDIERIEIIRGPQSSLRGSDAMSGVVNIITRSANQPFSAKVFAEAGSFSTQRSGFSVGHKRGDFDIRLGVSDTETEGVNISRSGDEKDGYENTSITFKSGFKVSDELTFSVAARQSDGMNEFDADNDFDGFVEDQDRASEFRNRTMRVQGDYMSADGIWQHKLLIAQSSNDNEAFADGILGNVTASTKDQYQYIGSMFWDGSAQRVSFLAELEEEDFKQRGPLNWGLDPNQDRERDTNSFAIEYRTDISESLTLAASARYDNNSEFESANTYRVEAVFQLNDSARLRSAYGTAVKNPTFAERFGFYTNFIGNPSLEPEESTSWELGIDKQLGQLSLSATLFDSELDNEIDGFVYEPVIFGYTAGNKEGTSKRQGAELTAIGALGNNLSLNATYTYTDSVESDGAGGYKDEVRRARHTASLNLAWQVMANLHINTNAQYNGSQTDVFFPPWPTPSETVVLSEYTLLNVSAHFNATESLDIYLRLDNLLDDNYEEVFGYQTLGFGASVGLRFSL